MCKKMGLGQQALADAFHMKRGKVSGYFYETQPKPDFFEKLGEKFDLDIGKFLTLEMNDINYDSFFGVKTTNHRSESKSSRDQQSNSKVFDLLIDIRNSKDEKERSRLLDEVIKSHGEVLEENSKLKDANSELKDDLIAMAKKLLG